ncbi:hypothetical protein ABZX92_22585 [Lentzea sp. NPDC006480]|uniref:hypothetical protein n=1 Tax=Lentzea sp. NPDC006480 TaxID=3157176 RepID=UPI0033A1E3D3
MDFERELAESHHYAVFKNGVGGVDRASMLVRRPERHREEEYAGHGLWVDTDKLYRLDSGRDWNDDYRALTEAEARELRQQIDTGWATAWNHHVISADGTPFAVVVSAKDPKWGAGPYRIGRHEHRGHGRTDLLDRVPDEPTWSVEDVQPAAAIEALVRMEERKREDPWYSGGYAVFDTLIDVLDLDSAYAVVPRPGPEHEFTARLSEQEARRLTALIGLRRAKQQAGPVAGHQYFALFIRTEDAVDPRNAHSVIRSTVDSWPQKWEVFLRQGEWLPAVRPSDRTLLPLAAADLDAVTAALMSREHRYLKVRSRETGPVALLRLTGTTEESAVDLGWEPSDVLTRLPGERSWFVGEVDEQGVERLRYTSALQGRSVRFAKDEYRYFAVFPSHALDLSQAVLVIRRRDEAEEKFAGPAGWVPVGPGEEVGRAYPGRFLPISHAEMERLIS